MVTTNAEVSDHVKSLSKMAYAPPASASPAKRPSERASNVAYNTPQSSATSGGSTSNTPVLMYQGITTVQEVSIHVF